MPPRDSTQPELAGGRPLTYILHPIFYFTRQTTMDSPNIIPFEQPEPVPGYPSKPMKSSLVVKASKIIEDPQILVNVVSKRVAQLNQGRSPLVDTVPSMGSADIRGVARGMIA